MSSMIILQKYNAMREKLDNTLEANGLIGTFVTGASPIMLTVTPNVVDVGQVSLLPEVDDDKSSLDAKLSFVFKEGDVTITTDEKLVIAESLMNKIKNIAKKMHYLYLQAAYEAFISGEQPHSFETQVEESEHEDADHDMGEE